MQCTFGSRAQAGAPAYFWFTWSAFIAWLALRFARLGTIVWAFFADSPFHVADFCATEIVLPTAPTTADWLGFFTLDFRARVTVENYLLEAFKAYLWGSYCECIPTTFSGSCHPWYTSSPTFVDESHGSGGWSWGVRFTPSDNLQNIYGVRVWRPDSWDNQCKIRLWDCTTTGNLIFQTFPCIAGSGSNPQTIYFDSPISLANTHNYCLAQVATTDRILTASGGISGTHGPINYGPAFHNADGNVLGDCVGSEANHFGIDAIICDADPRGLVPYVAPVPVDPTDIPDHPEVSCTTTADLCSRVNALQSALLVTNQQINWLQSSTAPTCWIPDPAPLTGLVGAGTFAVTDVIGLYVQLTVPLGWGRTSETPARMIPKLGELHPTTDGVLTDEFQLHYASEQFIRIPIATNGFEYSLKPGVTATMTPLHRCK